MALYAVEKATGGKVFFCAQNDDEADRFIREKVFPGQEMHREDEVNHVKWQESVRMTGAKR
jgi:hypothetical protein